VVEGGWLKDSDIDHSVIQHILFHKSLAEDTSHLDRYLEILEKTKMGSHLNMEDPFDKSIALAFELVLQQRLDPWAIDLAKFSSLYIKRAKKENVDLVVAGKILYMAWKILNMQSQDVRISAEESEQMQEEISWDDFAIEDWQVDEQSYTRMVVDGKRIPIIEPVRRKADRRVSLIELIEAFDLARKEAEEYQLLEKLRKKERERILREAQNRMKGSVHEEHFEEEIEKMWKRIQRFNGRAIPLKNLCNFNNKEERLTALIAVLHLASDGKIRVYQRRFPFGMIYVRNMT